MATDISLSTYPEYPLFKGLQKPLEFMGLQGRYIYWAAGTVGVALISFILAYLLSGFLLSLICTGVVLGIGSALIMLKQKEGLHAKKKWKGVFVYAYTVRN